MRKMNELKKSVSQHLANLEYIKIKAAERNEEEKVAVLQKLLNIINQENFESLETLLQCRKIIQGIENIFEEPRNSEPPIDLTESSDNESVEVPLFSRDRSISQQKDLSRTTEKPKNFINLSTDILKNPPLTYSDIISLMNDPDCEVSASSTQHSTTEIGSGRQSQRIVSSGVPLEFARQKLMKTSLANKKNIVEENLPSTSSSSVFCNKMASLKSTDQMNTISINSNKNPNGTSSSYKSDSRLITKTAQNINFEPNLPTSLTIPSTNKVMASINYNDPRLSSALGKKYSQPQQHQDSFQTNSHMFTTARQMPTQFHSNSTNLCNYSNLTAQLSLPTKSNDIQMNRMNTGEIQQTLTPTTPYKRTSQNPMVNMSTIPHDHQTIAPHRGFNAAKNDNSERSKYYKSRRSSMSDKTDRLGEVSNHCDLNYKEPRTYGEFKIARRKSVLYEGSHNFYNTPSSLSAERPTTLGTSRKQSALTATTNLHPRSTLSTSRTSQTSQTTTATSTTTVSIPTISAPSNLDKLYRKSNFSVSEMPKTNTSFKIPKKCDLNQNKDKDKRGLRINSISKDKQSNSPNNDSKSKSKKVTFLKEKTIEESSCHNSLPKNSPKDKSKTIKDNSIESSSTNKTKISPNKRKEDVNKNNMDRIEELKTSDKIVIKSPKLHNVDDNAAISTLNIIEGKRSIKNIINFETSTRQYKVPFKPGPINNRRKSFSAIYLNKISQDMESSNTSTDIESSTDEASIYSTAKYKTNQKPVTTSRRISKRRQTINITNERITDELNNSGSSKRRKQDAEWLDELRKSRSNGQLAALFKKTDDNCRLSTQNIISGKRSTRSTIYFNETALSNEQFYGSSKNINTNDNDNQHNKKNSRLLKRRRSLCEIVSKNKIVKLNDSRVESGNNASASQTEIVPNVPDASTSLKDSPYKIHAVSVESKTDDTETSSSKINVSNSDSITDSVALISKNDVIESSTLSTVTNIDKTDDAIIEGEESIEKEKNNTESINEEKDNNIDHLNMIQSYSNVEECLPVLRTFLNENQFNIVKQVLSKVKLTTTATESIPKTTVTSSESVTSTTITPKEGITEITSNEATSSQTVTTSSTTKPTTSPTNVIGTSIEEIDNTNSTKKKKSEADHLFDDLNDAYNNDAIMQSLIKAEMNSGTRHTRNLPTEISDSVSLDSGQCTENDKDDTESNLSRMSCHSTGSRTNSSTRRSKTITQNQKKVNEVVDSNRADTLSNDFEIENNHHNHELGNHSSLILRSDRVVKNTNPNWHAQYKEKHICVVCSAEIQFSSIHYTRHHNENFLSRIPQANLKLLKKDILNKPLFGFYTKSKYHFVYICPFCNDTNIGQITPYVEHISTHTSEGLYQCSKCFKCMIKLNTIKKHMKQSCKKGKIITYLSTHFKSEKDRFYFSLNMCHLCNFVQIKMENLEKHYAKQHNLTAADMNKNYCELVIMNITEDTKLVSHKYAEHFLKTKLNNEHKCDSTNEIVNLYAQSLDNMESIEQNSSSTTSTTTTTTTITSATSTTTTATATGTIPTATTTTSATTPNNTTESSNSTTTTTTSTTTITGADGAASTHSKIATITSSATPTNSSTTITADRDKVNREVIDIISIDEIKVDISPQEWIDIIEKEMAKDKLQEQNSIIYTPYSNENDVQIEEMHNADNINIISTSFSNEDDVQCEEIHDEYDISLATNIIEKSEEQIIATTFGGKDCLNAFMSTYETNENDSVGKLQETLETIQKDDADRTSNRIEKSLHNNKNHMSIADRLCQRINVFNKNKDSSTSSIDALTAATTTTTTTTTTTDVITYINTLIGGEKYWELLKESLFIETGTNAYNYVIDNLKEKLQHGIFKNNPNDIDINDEYSKIIVNLLENENNNELLDIQLLIKNMISGLNINDDIGDNWEEIDEDIQICHKRTSTIMLAENKRESIFVNLNGSSKSSVNNNSEQQDQQTEHTNTTDSSVEHSNLNSCDQTSNLNEPIVIMEDDTNHVSSFDNSLRNTSVSIVPTITNGFASVITPRINEPKHGNINNNNKENTKAKNKRNYNIRNNNVKQSVEHISFKIEFVKDIIVMKFYCMISGCRFKYADTMIGIGLHFINEHADIEWSGFCITCKKQISKDMQGQVALTINDEIQHIIDDHLNKVNSNTNPKDNGITIKKGATTSKSICSKNIICSSASANDENSATHVTSPATEDVQLVNNRTVIRHTNDRTEQSVKNNVDITQKQIIAGTNAIMVNTPALIPSTLIPTLPSSDVVPVSLTNADDEHLKTIRLGSKIKCTINVQIAKIKDKEPKIPQCGLNVRTPVIAVTSSASTTTAAVPPAVASSSLDYCSNQSPIQEMSTSSRAKTVSILPHNVVAETTATTTITTTTTTTTPTTTTPTTTIITTTTTTESSQSDEMKCMQENCTFGTRNLSKLTDHLKLHDTYEIDDSYLKCSLCDFKGVHVSNLIRHIGYKHVQNEIVLKNNKNILQKSEELENSKQLPSISIKKEQGKQKIVIGNKMTAQIQKILNEGNGAVSTIIPIDNSTQSNINCTLASAKTPINSASNISTDDASPVNITSENKDPTFIDAIHYFVNNTGIKTDELYRCVFNNCNEALNSDSFCMHLGQHVKIMGSVREHAYQLHCRFCTASFQRPMDLKSHLNQTHAQHRYFCFLCLTTKNSMKKLKNHISQAHGPISQITSNVIYREIDKLSNTIEYVIPYTSVLTENDREDVIDRLVEKYKEGIKGSKSKFSSDEIHLVPFRSTCKNVLECAECHYSTKIRSNFIRHLHLHLNKKLNINSEIDNVDPVNPVPCLSNNVKHFDKMTNLASSSTREQKRSIHKVPYAMIDKDNIYKCGNSNCDFFTLLDNLFYKHIALDHSSSHNEFICVFCQEKICEKGIKIEQVKEHLKYHGKILYHCEECNYLHYSSEIMIQHLQLKHHNKKVRVVKYTREKYQQTLGKTSYQPKEVLDQFTYKGTNSYKPIGQENTVDIMKNNWICNLCNCLARNLKQMSEHCTKEHNFKHQFNCSNCQYNTSKKANMMTHCRKVHPGNSNNYVHIFRKFTKEDKQNIIKQNVIPTWQRNNINGVRHIRGIPIEDEEESARHINVDDDDDEYDDYERNTENTIGNNTLENNNSKYSSNKMNNNKTGANHLHVDNNVTTSAAQRISDIPSTPENIFNKYTTIYTLQPTISATSVPTSTIKETPNSIHSKPKKIPTTTESDNLIMSKYEVGCYYCNYSCNSIKKLYEEHHQIEHTHDDNNENVFCYNLLLQLKCPYCDNFVGNWKLLDKHIKELHSNNPFLSIACQLTGNGVLSCAHCHYMCKSIEQLKIHQKNEQHSPSDIKDIRRPELDSLLKRKIGISYYICTVCNMILTDNSYNNHICQHSDKLNGDVIFQVTHFIYCCSYCTYASNDVISVERHLIDHYEKFQRCHLCNAVQTSFNTYMLHCYNEKHLDLSTFHNIYPFKDIKYFIEHNLLILYNNGLIMKMKNLQNTRYNVTKTFKEFYKELEEKVKQPPIPPISIGRLFAIKSSGNSFRNSPRKTYKRRKSSLIDHSQLEQNINEPNRTELPQIITVQSPTLHVELNASSLNNNKPDTESQNN